MLSASSNSFSQTVRETTPQEAWDALTAQEKAQLIDVRTASEWQQVGVPDLSSFNKKAIALSWRTLPGMMLNTQFEAQVMEAIPDRATPLYFLCRVGGRSSDAAQAMARMGYTHCCNVAGGFEQWQQMELPWSRV